MSQDKSSDLRNDAILDAPQLGDGPFEAPFRSPVQPTQLTLDDTIQFNCHKGIACFNECCKSIEIQLTPYDILRLKRHLDLSSKEFVARYTMPFEMDHHGMPGLKLAHQPGTSACIFLKEEGCGVYEDRPAACRYYALGSMGVRKKDAGAVEDIYFLVKEAHCLGHDEPRQLTVREYRQEQGVEIYDELNQDWRDIVIKKRTSGPTVGQPSARSMQLFDMCSYDLDSFREFVQSDGFNVLFDVDQPTLDKLLAEEEELLRFAMRFLKQVLYGEHTIPVKEGAREKRLDDRRDVLKARREADIAAHKGKEGFEDYIPE